MVKFTVDYIIPEDEVKRVEKMYSKKWEELGLTFEPCSSVEMLFIDEDGEDVIVEAQEV